MSAVAGQDQAAALLGRGTPLSADELGRIGLFKSVSRKLLEDNAGAVVLRNFERGEMICRQGDYGATAFYVLSGTCDVFINTPIGNVDTRMKKGGLLGLVRKAVAMLGGDNDESKPRTGAPPFVHIDASVDLPWGEFRASVGENTLLGEMTCLSHYPRSATVVARDQVVCIEMLRNILELILRSEPQTKWRKEKQAFLKANPGKSYDVPRPEEGPIGKAYRQRALLNHLRDFPLFKQLPDDFLEQLRQNADLVSLEPGEVIFRQDETADDFYIVRSGFVKVSQKWPGGEVVLRYLSRGQYFGEIALLARAEGREVQRTATCTAIDHVELVAISGEDFAQLIGQFPEVAKPIRAQAKTWLKADADFHKETHTTQLTDYLEKGLMQAQSLLVLDLDRCTRCDECVRACADSHDGVTRLVRDGLRFDKYLVATSCRSCLDPVCMIGCPVGSIVRENTREIRIQDWCIGCELCASNCPYGNINMHTVELEATSRLYGKQTPLREVSVKLDSLPADFDLTTLPEGASYDFVSRTLMFAGVPNEKNRGRLLEYSDAPQWKAAVERIFEQMQTRVPLPVLPSDFKPQKRLAPFISYDAGNASLVFLGIISPEDKADYLAFSTDRAYKEAVEQAARAGASQKAVVRKAITCDLCESVNRGTRNSPNCVYACPHEAALRVTPAEFFEPLMRSVK